MSLKFSKSTDSEQEIKLDSYLISAMFQCSRAVPGGEAPFEVLTGFVGDGAPIKIKGKSENGADCGTINGVVRGNSFLGNLSIPEDIEPGDKVYYEVKLKKNGIDEESERIPVVPRLRFSNLRWSASEARRGDVLTLSADVTGLRDGSEVTVTIYEYDQDGAHDRITEIPARVRESKVELRWEYEYHEDTDEIATQEELEDYGGNYNPPEYFFTVKYQGTEFGTDQESQLLTFKDWIEIFGEDAYGEPLRGGEYKVTFANNEERSGNLNDEGYVRLEDVPPGAYSVEFPPEDEDDADDSSGDSAQQSDDLSGSTTQRRTDSE